MGMQTAVIAIIANGPAVFQGAQEGASSAEVLFLGTRASIHAAANVDRICKIQDQDRFVRALAFGPIVRHLKGGGERVLPHAVILTPFARGGAFPTGPRCLQTFFRQQHMRGLHPLL